MFRSNASKTLNRPTPNGYSLAELLVVLAFIGIIAGASAAAWRQYERKTTLLTTAQVFKRVIYQARLKAIFHNVNHFVVYDPAEGSLTIVEDTSDPIGGYDAGDTEIMSERLPVSVDLSLPGSPSPLVRPLGNGNLAEAWELPDPDPSAEWGSDKLGVMMNPEGRIMSGEEIPTVIGFSLPISSKNQTVCLLLLFTQ